MLVDDLFENVAGPEKCWPGHRKVGTQPGTGKNAGKRVNDCEKIKESHGDFNVGDPVIITGNVEYQGRTGDVREVGRDGAFVVVDLYNHGPQSFHSSDVSYNDYADSEDDLNEFALDDGDDPTEDYPCYDCGSTIFLHHTKSCDLAEPNAKRDLPAEPGTQYWTGQVPKGLAPISGLAEGVNDDNLNDYYSGYYADLLSQIENMSAADQVDTKLGIKRSLENNEIRLVDLKTEIRSLERELKKLSVAEGFIKDPGPLDLSANPTKSQVWARYMSIYDYEGYQGDENSQEMQDLEDYAARHFGQDMVNDMLSAGYQSYFGRDDNPSKPIDQGTGNYTSLARSAISAANIKKDGKLTKRANADTKQRVADRLGRHPEPNLPEQSVAETDRVGNMPADKFDDAMARLKQLAGAGPLKTVWDPQKRVYRNMPTAVQPKK
jgi:hypothetical protein